MSYYHHLSISEREKILVLRIKGESLRAIAKEIGRCVSTVSREIIRNSYSKQGYSAVSAEKKYRERRKKCKRHKLLCIAYALGLSLEEPNLLLYLSGKPKLYPRVKRDAVLIFGLFQKLSVSQVDDLLYEAKEATLLGK